MNNSPNIKIEGELTEEYILSVLPQFFSVDSQDLPAYIEDMRKSLVGGNYDMFLSLLRDSFSQFLYNDFMELERHYCNHLLLVSALMRKIPGFSSDFNIEGMVLFGMPDTVIAFNLRGSAEEGIEKGERLVGENHDAPFIGVSFSAFDRTIDRWTRR